MVHTVISLTGFLFVRDTWKNVSRVTVEFVYFSVRWGWSYALSEKYMKFKTGKMLEIEATDAWQAWMDWMNKV